MGERLCESDWNSSESQFRNRRKCDASLYSGIARGETATSMSAENALDESLHVLVVGAGPVEAIAGGADTKIVITLSRSWRQPVMDRLFRNLL